MTVKNSNDQENRINDHVEYVMEIYKRLRVLAEDNEVDENRRQREALSARLEADAADRVTDRVPCEAAQRQRRRRLERTQEELQHSAHYRLPIVLLFYEIN